MVGIRSSAATLLAALLAGSLATATPSIAQDVVKIGMLAPMTGPFTSTGKQLVAGALEHLELDWLHYCHGYRTPAGTGTGLCFALWA